MRIGGKGEPMKRNLEMAKQMVKWQAEEEEDGEVYNYKTKIKPI